MDRKLVRRLEAMRQRYTSLEEMAESLRSHPGFEDLNRATLSRWLKHPTQRARVAVQILNSKRSAVRLRLAEPQALSLIPACMLHWEAEERKPYGLLEKAYGVVAEVHPTTHGRPALELLVQGKVEIALVPGDLLNQLGRDCRRICALAKLHLTGIATKEIRSVSDLKGKTFGFLSSSAFGLRLNEVARTWGIALPAPLPLQTPNDCVQALLAGQIDGMVGSEPSVSQIRRAVARSLQVFPIPQGVLGWFEMHVAVNLKIAHPASVRAYLCGLQETTRYANARKSVTGFQAEVALRFNMDQWDVRNILTNTIFSLGDFEPTTVLTLWEREVVDLRKR